MIISRTPHRISIMGGGSDLPSFFKQQEGRVLCATINLYNYVVINKNSDGAIRFSFDNFAEKTDHAKDLIPGITREVLEQFNIDKGIDIHSTSEVSGKGSGLGSSSAYTVGLINALLHYKKLARSSIELAMSAIHIETEKCGYPIGYQDQLATACGGYNLFNFSKDGEIFFDNTKYHPSTFQNHLLLVYTGLERNSLDILTEQNKSMDINSSKPHNFDVIKSFANFVPVASDLLYNQNYKALGELMSDAWELKKTLVNTISNDYIDDLYKLGMENGAWGGKLLGAGAGGHFLFVCPNSKRFKIANEILDSFPKAKIVPFEFTNEGSKIVYHD